MHICSPPTDLNTLNLITHTHPATGIRLFFSSDGGGGGGGDSRNYQLSQGGGGHHRTPSGSAGAGGLPASLAGVNPGYLGIGGMGHGMGSMHAAQAYGMATPRLMQASAAVMWDGLEVLTALSCPRVSID